ncbi:MAG: SCO family protein [Gammaproteobacteria bacterium]|nr:SCO family protein [Gammaproteobacteria bacterium]
MDIYKIIKPSSRTAYAFILCVLLSAGQVNAAKLGGEFELTSHKGETFRLSDIKGKVGIIFFGFTHCPDVCPNTLLEIQRLIINLEDQAKHLKVLFISVDPKRDTPSKLNSYVTYFNKNIIGLTGSQEDIAKVLKQFNASVKFSGDTSSETYNVEHTANIFLINKQGDIGSIILPRTPFKVLEQQVRKLISE